MSRKKISVVCICRNNPGELIKTLSSLETIDPNLMEIVVVDGSDTTECRSAAIEAGFKVGNYILEKDTGKYNAMNKGVIAATGFGVIIINSGDEGIPDGITNVIQYCTEDQFDNNIIYGGVINIIGNSEIVVAPLVIDRKKLDAGILPSHQATIIPRSFYEYCRYDESMDIAADTKLMRAAFETLNHTRVDFAIAKFAFGGVSSTPGKWSSVLQHYRETVEARKLKPVNKIRIAAHLVLRKLIFDALGKDKLQAIQATLAEARNIRRPAK